MDQALRGTKPMPADAGVGEFQADWLEQGIIEFLDLERKVWDAEDPSIGVLLDVLKGAVVNGGKRLRPRFCYWAWYGAGGDDDDEQVWRLCAALELVHTLALIHDDIMDQSTTRRGQAALYRQFADLHRERSWNGDSDVFGTNVGILAGDLAFAYSDIVLGQIAAPVRAVWHALRVELAFGQYLDLIGAAGPAVERSRAERIVRYKSAKYTVERPLHLGAFAAMPDFADSIAGPLSSVGLPLGAAFQQRDDLLGAFGDPEVTGKPVGDDFREGKCTLLIVEGRERGSAAERQVLARLGTRELSDRDIEAIQTVLVETGAKRAVEARISALIDTSIEAIADLPFRALACERLTELAIGIGIRNV